MGLKMLITRDESLGDALFILSAEKRLKLPSVKGKRILIRLLKLKLPKN